MELIIAMLASRIAIPKIAATNESSTMWPYKDICNLNINMRNESTQANLPFALNVLDGLLLALAEFQILLLVTFLFVLPSSNEALPLIYMIASGFPQLVLLLSVTYRKLKGQERAKYISQKFYSVIKKMCTRIQVENELSDDDPLPHRLVNPNQYNRSLLSEEQTHANSETLTIQGKLTPVYTYGSVS